MAYAFIKDDAIAAYPYSVTQLRRDNPHTSFPKRPSDDMLAEWGVHPVTDTPRPEHDPMTQDVAEGDPVLKRGKWVRVWIVTDATAEEIVERTEQAANSVRSQRNQLLFETDWMALSDNTMSPEWFAYRQSLRDITDHANFPWLNDADWPVKPE